MAIDLYDNALLQKVKEWVEPTNLHIFGVSDTKRVFEVIADTTDDKPIQLPLITIRRPSGYTVVTPNRQPLSYDGYTPEATFGRSKQYNAVPISVQYQLDVYARYLAEADDYMRNLIFNFINFPYLRVEVPYFDENFIHESTLQLGTEIEDNSDIPERAISGQFTRLTLSLTVSDAYLWDIRTRDNYHVVVDDVIMS